MGKKNSVSGSALEFHRACMHITGNLESGIRMRFYNVEVDASPFSKAQREVEQLAHTLKEPVILVTPSFGANGNILQMHIPLNADVPPHALWGEPYGWQRGYIDGSFDFVPHAAIKATAHYGHPSEENAYFDARYRWNDKQIAAEKWPLRVDRRVASNNKKFKVA